MDYIEVQDGSVCSKCIEKGRNGIMELKSGRFGKFLGCNNYPNCYHSESVGVNLESLATQLLEKERKVTRRSKRKSKRLAIEKRIEHREIVRSVRFK